MNFDNYECDGQITLEEYIKAEERKNPKLQIPKAPIYHMSLNHVWEECPNCKAYNKATVYEIPRGGGDGYWVELPECPECGQKFDWSEEAVEAACKKTKEYIKAEEEQRKKNERQ